MYGFAFCLLCIFFLIVGADLQLLTVLDLYSPTEVLIPNTASELSLLLRNNYSRTEIVNVARKYFSELRGQAYVKQLAHSENKTIDVEFASK